MRAAVARTQLSLAACRVAQRFAPAGMVSIYYSKNRKQCVGISAMLLNHQVLARVQKAAGSWRVNVLEEKCKEATALVRPVLAAKVD